MSHFLVTGGAGFIGQNLVQTLIEKNHQITVLDNLCNSTLQNLHFAKNNPSFNFIKGDIRHLDTCLSATKTCDFIVHLASLTSVPESIKKPILYHDTMINGTLNLLECCRQHPIKKFIFASSAAVYGETSSEPIKETTQKKPLSPYGFYKLIGEKYCEAFQKQYNIETTILRFFNVFGPGQLPHSDYASVIPKFIWKMIQNNTPSIYGDGEQTRDFIYVKSVAEAIYNACIKSYPSNIFNIGSGTALTINQLHTTLKNLTNFKQEAFYEKPREGDILFSISNNTKAKKELEIKPKEAHNTGLNRTVLWLKELHKRS